MKKKILRPLILFQDSGAQILSKYEAMPIRMKSLELKNKSLVIVNLIANRLMNSNQSQILLIKMLNKMFQKEH